MSEDRTFVRIDGEPFLSRARDYRERRHAWHRAWGTFAESKGAQGFGSTGHHLCFRDGNPPEGWTRPKGKDRFSCPKKGHPDAAAFERMRAEWPCPRGEAVFDGAICRKLIWEGADGSKGSGNIGSFRIIIDGPWIGWAGETFFADIPDAEAATLYFAERYPDRRIVGEAATWCLPTGLTRLTDAEYELALAQHKVAEERARAPLASPDRSR